MSSLSLLRGLLTELAETALSGEEGVGTMPQLPPQISLLQSLDFKTNIGTLQDIGFGPDF